MNLAKTSPPFNQMVDNFFNSSISELIGTDFTVNQPSVNIIEGDTSFSIEVAAPGFKKKDFNIELKEGKLRVKAQVSETKELNLDSFTRREFNFDSFERSFHLPKTVNAESINATYKLGLLNISIDKLEPSPEISKTIKIN